VIADRITRLPIGPESGRRRSVPALCRRRRSHRRRRRRRRRESYTRNPSGGGGGEGVVATLRNAHACRWGQHVCAIVRQKPELRRRGGGGAQPEGTLWAPGFIAADDNGVSPLPSPSASIAVAARAFRVKPDSRRRESVVPRRHGILKVPRLRLEWPCPRRFSVLVGVAGQWLFARHGRRDERGCVQDPSSDPESRALRRPIQPPRCKLEKREAHPY